jgi:hypothetical protein
MARIEMIEDVHEFAKVDIGNAGVAANHGHVHVVGGLRGPLNSALILLFMPRRAVGTSGTALR